MSNTIDANLSIDMLVADAQVKLTSTFSPRFNLKDCEYQYPATGTGSVKVKVATASSPTNKAASTFGEGASTVTLADVNVDLYSHDIHVSASEYNDGIRLKDILSDEIRLFSDNLLSFSVGNSTIHPHNTIIDSNFYTHETPESLILEKKTYFPNNLSTTVFVTNKDWAGLIPTDTLEFDPSMNGIWGMDGVYRNTVAMPYIGFLMFDKTQFTIVNSATPAGGSADDSTVITLPNGLEARLDVWFDENAQTQRACLTTLLGSHTEYPILMINPT